MAARHNHSNEDEVIPPDPTVAESVSNENHVEISAPALNAGDSGEVEDPRHARQSDPNHAELSPGDANPHLEDVIEDISSDEEEYPPAEEERARVPVVQRRQSPSGIRDGLEFPADLDDRRHREPILQAEEISSDGEEDARFDADYRNGLFDVRRMPADSSESRPS
uniref:DUF5709 domain-containing protein n=1 Tax=Steinernema glaseri TaxID=37863 RepID=A0A1I7Y604_9BILA